VVNPIQPPGNNPKPRSRLRTVLIGRNPRMTLLRVAVWAVVCFLIFKIALVRVEVDGISMLPTYQDQSKNWINRLAYLRHEPRRGDVVGIGERGKDDARRVWAPSVMFLKRIIGLPGETVAFSGGRVLVNGQILDEPYENFEKFPSDWDRPPVKLAADEYFVVGDNRTMPEQDHVFGICKRHQIIGKILP
jgi:signal peptidase I